MPRRTTLIYIGQAVILGLAIAFVVTILWPSVTGRPPAPAAVEIKQTAPTGTARPARGEGPVSYAAAVESAAPAVVNINTATAAELDDLPGIGEVYSQRIVESRTWDGPYQTTEELVERRVIPRGTYEKIADLITVGP